MSDEQINDDVTVEPADPFVAPAGDVAADSDLLEAVAEQAGDTYPERGGVESVVDAGGSAVVRFADGSEVGFTLTNISR